MLAVLPELQPDFHRLIGRRHVALAVSGGSDSIALLRLARDWAAAQAKPPKLSVLTVDHGLRPGSSHEAARVAEWCAGLALDHFTLTWIGPKPETGLQSKARKARYDLLSSWCSANTADMLLTAHTMDDQAETVLMRLGRTGSPDSLAGIPPLGQWNGLHVLRPLLSLRRNGLRQYLESVDQQWIDDPSNMDRRFERVRVRSSLEDFADSPVTAERLVALGTRCARTSALLDTCSENWLRLWLKEDDAGICFAPIEPFLALPGALQQRIFGRIVTHYGGGSFQPEREELVRLTGWLKQGPVRRTLGGAILGKRKDQFWVTREVARIDSSPQIVPEGGQTLWDGRFLIAAPQGSTIIPAGGRAVGLGDTVPIYARRACPFVKLPKRIGEGSAETRVAFLSIRSS